MSERPSSWSPEDGKSRDSNGFTGLHFDNLYDEDEDRAGEKIDLATGEPIDNSDSLRHEMESTGINIIDPSDYDAGEWHDVLPPLDDNELPEEIRKWADLYKDEIDALASNEDEPKY